jgi:drug/metabolite transporter (DMT)-like permease
VITKQSFINLGWLSFINFLWGSQFPAYKLASDYVNISALNTYIFIIALIVLLPFLARERAAARQLRAAPPAPPRPKMIKSWLALGACLVPASIGLSWGIAHSSGTNGAILYLMVPVLMLIIAVPLLGERLTWMRIGTLLLSLAGAIVVSIDDLVGGQFTMSTLLGNLAIVSGCLCSAFYNTYSKKMLERYTAIEILVFSDAIAAVLCGVISLWIDDKPFYDVSGIPFSAWISIVALGSIIWGVSMVMFLWLLSRVDVALVAVSLYLQAFFGVLLSALMLGEHLRAMQVIGALTIAVATLLADSYERREKNPAMAT